MPRGRFGAARSIDNYLSMVSMVAKLPDLRLAVVAGSVALGHGVHRSAVRDGYPEHKE
jgi:hypothetical protein